MTDAVQMPTYMPVVPRVAPVHAALHVEPPKKSQAENQNAKDRRQDGGANQPKALDSNERQLRIMHDDAAKAFVYKSVEAETGEVVWQWPTEQILRRAKYHNEAEAQQQRHEVDEKA